MGLQSAVASLQSLFLEPKNKLIYLTIAAGLHLAGFLRPVRLGRARHSGRLLGVGFTPASGLLFAERLSQPGQPALRKLPGRREHATTSLSTCGHASSPCEREGMGTRDKQNEFV